METYWKIAYREPTPEGTKQRREVLGFVTEKEANELLLLWKADRLRGVASPQPSASPSSGGKGKLPTIAEWWGDTTEPFPAWPPCRMRDWIDARGFKPKTRRLADCARRAIVRDLGTKRLDEITPAVGDAFVAGLKVRGLKSRSCQIYNDWLRRSLEVAAADGDLTAAPKLNRPRDTDRRKSKWHTPEQTAALLTELDRRVVEGICSADAALAIRMEETLIMRPGEVLSRRWSHLARDSRWTSALLEICDVDLPDGTTWFPKNEESYRTLAVPPVVLARLREQWERQGKPRDGWIFPQEDRPEWPRTSFKKALAGACRAAGLPVLHPHALRHTGATRLAFNKADRKTLMAIGGWATGEMLDEVYAHTNESRMADLLAASEVKPVPTTDDPPDATPAG